MKLVVAPPWAPGDYIAVCDSAEEAATIEELADDIVDVNLEKGRAHLLVDGIVVTVVVRRLWEEDRDALMRAAGRLPRG